MKTTLLIKKHETALAYLHMISECKRRVKSHAASADFHAEVTFLLGIRNHYKAQVTRYIILAAYIADRYQNTVKAITA